MCKQWFIQFVDKQRSFTRTFCKNRHIHRTYASFIWCNCRFCTNEEVLFSWAGRCLILLLRMSSKIKGNALRHAFMKYVSQTILSAVGLTPFSLLVVYPSPSTHTHTHTHLYFNKLTSSVFLSQNRAVIRFSNMLITGCIVLGWHSFAMEFGGYLCTHQFL